MRKGLVVSAIVASLLCSVSFAGNSKTSQVKGSSSKMLVKNEVKFQDKKLKMASMDIQKGLNDTLKAIDALHKNDVKTAKKALEEANKYFEKALKADPSLRLVPIENEIVAFQYQGGPKEIKAAVDIAKGLLDKNEVQFARETLVPLRDEIDITTHYIPMDLYPQSTKIATKLLEKGKTREALQELILGLSTIVGDQVVIPIPLLAAQDLVKAASKLDKKRKKDALALLDQAKVELEKAVLLGYTTAHSQEYKNLTKMINGIEKEIKGENHVEKLYENIKAKFKSLLGKTRHERQKLDSNNVYNGTKKEHQSAVKEENQDIVNFVTKQRLNAY
ncbi:MAG: YfdX family protein [Epsilonproteobacteria bacterium]|nr:YfdX family protein [Campylobacterota bacterium]